MTDEIRGFHSAPRRSAAHGRHSAAGQTSANLMAEASIPQPQERLTKLPTITERQGGDHEGYLDDAPRPIGVDPAATGSFARIDSAQGLRVTTRANASETAAMSLDAIRAANVRINDEARPKVARREEKVKADKRLFAGLAVAVFVVLLIGGTLLFRALGSWGSSTGDEVVEQTQTAADGSIEYRGVTYSLEQQEDGRFAVVGRREGAEKGAALFSLDGTPVNLILFNTAFVVPENKLDGTWDIMAMTLGEGSMASQVVNGEGNPVVGEGSITEARLEGEAINLTIDSGERLSVSLV